jgi:hypothetical protein
MRLRSRGGELRAGRGRINTLAVQTGAVGQVKVKVKWSRITDARAHDSESCRIDSSKIMLTETRSDNRAPYRKPSSKKKFREAPLHPEKRVIRNTIHMLRDPQRIIESPSNSIRRIQSSHKALRYGSAASQFMIDSCPGVMGLQCMLSPRTWYSPGTP